MTVRRYALSAAASAAVIATVIALPLSSASAQDRVPPKETTSQAQTETGPQQGPSESDGKQGQSESGKDGHSSEGTQGESEGHEDGNENETEDGVNGDHGTSGPYTIGLWGDQPYDAAGIAAEPSVLADINKQPLSFTIFDGDIKAGSKSWCGTDTKVGSPTFGWNPYDNAKTMFNTVKWPTIYTPGDNEWTDCDRASNGGLDPNAQLALIRSMFFSTNMSQGLNPIEVTQQSKDYPENARWERGGVTYITVNTPGTDNNAPQFDANGNMLDPDGAITTDPAKQNGNQAEYSARNEANLEWLEEGFDYAKEHHSKGVMIVQQGDMWNSAINSDPVIHYADEKAKLAELTSEFSGKVVLVNGDSHVLTIDNPLGLSNFTRLVTPGKTQHGWVKVAVDASTPNVFSFAGQILP
jgi:hypothetical protein